MSGFEIERLVITLNGVPAELAEEAVGGLAEELSRRVGVHRLESPGAGALEIGALEMRASANGPLDASALRALIAERFLAALAAAQAGPPMDLKETL